MKKLRLRLDTLSVDSFSTWAGTYQARGTVRGKEVSPTLFHPPCGTNSVCLTYPTGCPCTPRADEV